MVTTRRGQTNAELLKAKNVEMFGLIGRNDYVITNYSTSPTLNSRGRVTTQTTSTVSNVTGNLQFGTKVMRPYIDIGLAGQGDGIFFTLTTTTINPNDEVTVDSVTWKLVKQVEGESLPDGGGSGNVVYQAWITVRKP